MFESIDPRRYVLRICKLRLCKVVLADAARAVESRHVSWKAAVNDTLTTQTGHIRDPGERRAVFADGRVSRKGVHASTTFARKQIDQFGAQC